MRGADQPPGAMCNDGSLETRVPADRPLQRMWRIIDRAIERLSSGAHRGDQRW